VNYAKQQPVPKGPETKQGLTRWTKHVRPPHKTAAQQISGCPRTAARVPTNTLHVCLTTWQESIFLRGYTRGTALRKRDSSDEPSDKVPQRLVRGMFYSSKTNTTDPSISTNF